MTENLLKNIKGYFLILSFLSCLTAAAQENCNNGIDDDGDGKIDLNDSDCVCAATATVPSLVPNPSFETHAGCPSQFSQLYIATPWIQATDATTDYYNKCGFIMPSVIDAGLDNFPDGDGIAGALFLRDWNEYLGAPLTTPMQAGTNYQLTFNIAAVRCHGDGTTAGNVEGFYEPVSVTLYGCNSSTNMPLPITTNPVDADPTWVEVGHATYTPLGEWGQITILFTPAFNLNAIMIGPPMVLPVTYPTGNANDYPYFIFDNLVLNLASSFGVNIIQAGNFCDGNLILTANPTINLPDTTTYQWYRNGIAIVGATTATYSVNGSPASLGNYSVKIASGSTCYNSTTVTVNATTPAPNIIATQPTCIVVTGKITVTTPAAQYSFDNGATWQNSPVSNPLPIGSYYIKIKTINGCISSAAGINITEPQLLEGSDFTIVQPTTCDGTGSITVNSTIAAEYSFDDGVTWVTTATASNLQPDTYHVKIKDTNGCQSGSQYATINQIFLPSPDYTYVDPTCAAGGSITITTAASEYSFDDGITWQTINVATNLPDDSYSIKIRNSIGCESESYYVYLYEQLPAAPMYTSVEPTCENQGSITITTPGVEYSFDGGLTWTTSNTINNLPPDYYQIKIKDVSGCPSQTNYVYFYQPYLLTPNITIIHPFCTETTGTITVEPSPAYTYSFDGGLTYQSSNISNPLLPGSYIVVVKSTTGCESQGAYVYINDPSGIPEPPFGEAGQLFCVHNNPTVAFLVAQGENIRWYSSLGSTTPLDPTTPLLNGASYYATQTGINGCESQERFRVDVAVINYDIPVNNYETLICDDLNNGNENANFGDYNDLIIANSADYTFGYYNSFSGADTAIVSDLISNPSNYTLTLGEKMIYVRVIAANGCWRVAELKLTLISSPFNNMKTDYILCENKRVKIIADPGSSTYEWSTGQTVQAIDIYEPGNYWVTVTKWHGAVICSTTTNYTVVLSNPATVSNIVTTDWTENENTITVSVSSSSIGDYEYSLDGVHFQDSNTFTNLLSGQYTVYVNDKNGCGLSSEDVFLLTYSKFFTPNGDGFNETWKIKFSQHEEGLDVKIFDRYGKFLKQLVYDGPGWDGTYNRHDQPSNDYWFLVTRADGREYRGHFTLKR